MSVTYKAIDPEVGSGGAFASCSRVTTMDSTIV